MLATNQNISLPTQTTTTSSRSSCSRKYNGESGTIIVVLNHARFVIASLPPNWLPTSPVLVPSARQLSHPAPLKSSVDFVSDTNPHRLTCFDNRITLITSNTDIDRLQTTIKVRTLRDTLSRPSPSKSLKRSKFVGFSGNPIKCSSACSSIFHRCSSIS